MTRTVIAVAALALAARASATNGPKPKEISVKAAGKNSCEICPAGSAVKIDAVAGSCTSADDGVTKPIITEADCLRDPSNLWTPRKCGDLARFYREIPNDAVCEIVQDVLAADCCSNGAGGGMDGNARRPTPKPTGGVNGGPGDDGNGNGPGRPSGIVAVFKWENNPRFLLPYMEAIADDPSGFESAMNWTDALQRRLDQGEAFLRVAALRSFILSMPMCFKTTGTCTFPPLMDVVVGSQLPQGRSRRGGVDYDTGAFAEDSDDHSQATGESDQGRESDDDPSDDDAPRELSLRGQLLRVAEEWDGPLPQNLYPNGDLGIYHDADRSRYVILRALSLEGHGKKIIIAYATEPYDADIPGDRAAKLDDVLKASKDPDLLDTWATRCLVDYAARVDDQRTPVLERQDVQACINGIRVAYDEFDERARIRLRGAVLARLKKDFGTAEDSEGNDVPLEKLADYIMAPEKEMLWLGNPNYEDTVNEARADFDRESHRSEYGNLLRYINDQFRKKSDLFLEMITLAYAKYDLSPATLEKLAGFFETDHLHSKLCDDPVNFHLLFTTLNASFGFESWANFKKMYTGDAWAGVVFFVRRALQLQGRLYRAPPRPNSS